MTVNEYRLDFYKQDYMIVEHMTPDRTGVVILVSKTDTDNLRFEWRCISGPDILLKAQNTPYIDLLKNCTTNINNMITNRHAQNINNCSHELVMIGNTKACKHCMGKFGTSITIDMGNN